MSNVTLHPGDNRVTLRRLIDEGVRVHSVVTDPPYGLVSIQKRFGKEGAKNARTEGNDGSFARLSGGFMGKAWDGSGIERDPEFWALIYEILLPGGYVFAFSGSRTGHWQACAMEMAGFVMHPMHGWVFGSGFPKAHNAARAVDRAMGVTREVIGSQKAPGFAKSNVEHGQQGRETWEFPVYDDNPVTPEAAQWEGWAYGTQTQKPALEPIYLGQKPFDSKTGAANLLKHGVGAANIDGCRVAAEAGRPWRQPSHVVGGNSLSGSADGSLGNEIADKSHMGRHPANLILDGSPEVVAMFPDSKGQQGDLKAHGKARQSPNGIFGAMRPALDHPARNDSGSAARFFHHFPPDADPLFYHPKAGKTDRAGSKHPTVKPIALMQYLIRHITPPGGVVLDPFAGSGTTAEAARREGFDCILMEAEPEYLDFLRDRFGVPVEQPVPAFDFDDILGEAMPTSSTPCGTDHIFGDLL